MIGFGSRSRPRLTGRGTVGGEVGRGAAIAGEGPVDSVGGMSEDWGGKGDWSIEPGEIRGSVPHRHVAGEFECSGFSGRPKVVSVFAARRGVGDRDCPENVPIVSSLPNVTPISQVEDS